MEHIWTVLCQLSIRNQGTRNTSLIETLDRITFDIPNIENIVFPSELNDPVPGFPLEVVTLWWRSDLSEPEHFRAQLTLTGPDGMSLDKIEPFEYEVSLINYPKLVSNTRLVLPFKGSGVYRFNIAKEENQTWTQVASIPVEVVQTVTTKTD